MWMIYKFSRFGHLIEVTRAVAAALRSTHTH